MINLNDVLNKLKIELKDYYKAIEVDKISLDAENMNLFFDFCLKENIEKQKLKILENEISSRLKSFRVFFNYEIINLEKNIGIKELAESLIIKHNPSFNAFIDQIEIDDNLEKKELTIVFPNNTLYNNALNSGLMEKLSMALDEDEYEVFFKCDKDYCKLEECDVDDYIKNLDEEEDQIVKTINLKIKPESNKNISKEKFKYGKKSLLQKTDLKNIDSNSGKVTVEVNVFKIDIRELKNEKTLVSLSITDNTSSIIAKVFLKKDKSEEFITNVKEGGHYIITGDVQFDNFIKDDVIMIKYLEPTNKFIREDNSEEKRVELRLHTKMSTMNGVSSFESFVKRSKYWGMNSIAITDVADVQGFSDAMEASEKYDIKIIYGLDGNFVDDQEEILKIRKKTFDSYVVFDIETTGFSPRTDKITEIGAVKLKNGKIIDKFSKLINPKKVIPKRVEELTGLSNVLLENEPSIDEVIYDFSEFCNNSILVAHNAKFDISFIKREFESHGIKFDHSVLDTLSLARAVVKDSKRFNLSTLSKKLGVSLVGAHRAVNDAQATSEVFIKLLEIAKKEHGIEDILNINDLVKNIDSSLLFESPVSILVKTQAGMKNLYKLVSKSHLSYFNRVAKVPRTLLNQYREGLLIGSGNSSSILFRAIYNNESADTIKKIASYYDYLEIQPVDNNLSFIVNDLVKDKDELKNINKKIYEVGKELNIPVVATGDAFYLDEVDDLSRRIALSGQKVKTVENWNQPQSLYFKNTDEFLREFNYLGEEAAYDVVVKNTNIISNSIANLKPIPDGKFPPVIEGADEDLRRICYEKAHEIYGDELPEIVENRLDKELKSIISNGYSVLYIIAQKLVAKSNEDGYYVGSRGSVGSSFVATMSSITEVNPLPPHYICKNCKHSEFIEGGDYGSGVDLPDKKCPVCGSEMFKDGHDIPFEVFLGFKGDKEPDIDLNFAGEYQPRAHKYTEELFGKGYVFRAGTIGTIAEKTAYGYVKSYFGETSLRDAEIERLVKNIVGVKRTSGQHPGGVMICPKSNDIFDFTPIQYPADDESSGVITTHFDYNFIHGKILKLDILGHDGPTIIKMLEDFTGVDSSKLSLNDKQTLSLFSSSDALNLNKDIFNTSTGTLGIPEFGTNFVKQMLMETKPQNFAELVRISGLSHGTDVWTNNAQDLVKDGRAKLSDVICTREDIMLYLIRAGAENKMAFDTMERVRKGRGLTEEQIEIMNKLDLPEWYIESCKKIKYMFPKAHAVAYVTLSFRIAYFKLNYPLAFYATYFSIKLQDFDGELIIKGQEAVKAKIDEFKNSETKLSTKEKGQLTILEVVLEMFARGFEFENVDLYKSKSDKFSIKDGKVLFPFRAYVGIGDQIACNIEECSKHTEYLSIEDFVNKTKATKSVVEILKKNNVLKDLPDTNQLSLFNLF
ncbi:DNA polymerase III PolC-type [Peptoniphilus sp. ING2-D1G]|nr:DNA polymerase III PolC-type [Peptoniphilus sp. ING2-D1G]